MNKKLVIGVIVAVALIGGYFFPVGGQTIIERVTGGAGSIGADNPFSSVNGLQKYSYSAGWTTATSSVCSLKNPFGATSTILSLGVQETSLGTQVNTSMNFYVSTSTTFTGTTTAYNIISAYPMGAGQWSVEKADSSLANAFLLGPNDWITFKLGTSSLGTFTTYPTGSCTAELKKL